LIDISLDIRTPLSLHSELMQKNNRQMEWPRHFNHNLIADYLIAN